MSPEESSDQTMFCWPVGAAGDSEEKLMFVTGVVVVDMFDP
jgi:hypothetical protein